MICMDNIVCMWFRLKSDPSPHLIHNFSQDSNVCFLWEKSFDPSNHPILTILYHCSLNTVLFNINMRLDKATLRHTEC